ncbi:hypothetical protein FS837_007723 [Tulasnella sp. UAMH 9824]|nr:hypothetical protein FS837_007723 [Tulasnella sp. UAMH 9824]
MTSAKPLVAVCGATGAQGGSVARFLLQEGSFRVRALTRQPESAKALALSRQGADIVRADFNEPESLLDAFRGAYAVFGMTSYFDPSAEFGKKQVQQGKNIIDAAKACSVKHFVLSTAEHTGELNVSHWETQASINDYLIDSRLPRTSYVSPTEIKFSWAFPTDSTFAVYSSADTGGYVLNILKRPQEFVGRDVKIASEFISPRDWVSTMNEVLATRNTFVRVTLDEIDMKAFEAMQMLISNGAPPFRDPAYSRRVFPQLKTLWEIVDENWEKILAAAR